MNTKNYFKINYIESVLLVVVFITLNFFNIIFRKILYLFNLSDGIIFSISYTIPFIFLFMLISYQAKKKKLFINISYKFSPWYIYIIIFLMMLSIIIVNEYISSIIPRNGPILGKMYKEVDKFLKEEIKNPIPFFSTTVLLAPICEEVFFRGIILNGMLKNNINPIKAVIFSSFLFGLTHMNPWQLIGGLIIGSFIGFTYVITNSIIDCILLHIMNNLLAIISIFIFIKKNRNNIFLEDNIFNYLYPFIISILLLIIGSYILLKIKKNNNIKNI